MSASAVGVEKRRSLRSGSSVISSSFDRRDGTVRLIAVPIASDDMCLHTELPSSAAAQHSTSNGPEWVEETENSYHSVCRSAAHTKAFDCVVCSRIAAATATGTATITTSSTTDVDSFDGFHTVGTDAGDAQNPMTHNSGFTAAASVASLSGSSVTSLLEEAALLAARSSSSASSEVSAPVSARRQSNDSRSRNVKDSDSAPPLVRSSTLHGSPMSVTEQKQARKGMVNAADKVTIIAPHLVVEKPRHTHRSQRCHRDSHEGLCATAGDAAASDTASSRSPSPPFSNHNVRGESPPSQLGSDGSNLTSLPVALPVPLTTSSSTPSFAHAINWLANASPGLKSAFTNDSPAVMASSPLGVVSQGTRTSRNLCAEREDSTPSSSLLRSAMTWSPRDDWTQPAATLDTLSVADSPGLIVTGSGVTMGLPSFLVLPSKDSPTLTAKQQHHPPHPQRQRQKHQQKHQQQQHHEKTPRTAKPLHLVLGRRSSGFDVYGDPIISATDTSPSMTKSEGTRGSVAALCRYLWCMVCGCASPNLDETDDANPPHYLHADAHLSSGATTTTTTTPTTSTTSVRHEMSFGITAIPGASCKTSRAATFTTRNGAAVARTHLTCQSGSFIEDEDEDEPCFCPKAAAGANAIPFSSSST